MARENEAIFQCRHVTEARQTACDCVTNVLTECYLSTVDTSKRICIQYVHVGSIRCLSECRTVYECTICSASPLIHMHCSHSCSDLNPVLLVCLFSSNMLSYYVRCFMQYFSKNFQVFTNFPDVPGIF